MRGARRSETREAGRVRTGTPTGRYVVAAAVLGSGLVMLDGTVVNVALERIGADLEVGHRPGNGTRVRMTLPLAATETGGSPVLATEGVASAE